MVSSVSSQYSLCQIHNLETLGAHHSEFVLEEVDIERFGWDEEVLIQSEPL